MMNLIDELDFTMKQQSIIKKIEDELKLANSKYPLFRSTHQAYAVMFEEVDEVWEHVKKKPHERNLDELEDELVQVAAMACKFIWWVREQKNTEREGGSYYK